MSPARARAQRVIRCNCGQLVRIDRTLSEPRSEMLSEAPRNDDMQQRISLADDFGALGQAASTTSSGLHPSPPARSASARATPLPSLDKPLWYVDLGGIETLQMTIEQLIIARRTGKLGEGALVWRAGMTRWRPVGTLIPATPSQAPPKPAPPARTKQPLTAESRSYERPLATLEFALEDTETSGSELTPAVPKGVRKASSPPPSRVGTPLPRAASAARGTSQIGPLPLPAPLPAAPRSSALLARVAQPAELPAASAAAATPPADEPLEAQAQRPRWLSVALGFMICVAASGSGAFVVRALKTHRPSPPSNAAQAAPLTVGSPTAVPSAPGSATPAALEEPDHKPDVIAVDSLLVERKPKRAIPKPPSVTQEAPQGLEKHDGARRVEQAPTDATSSNSEATDLPAAARLNPYTIGEPQDALDKKPAPASSEAPGL